MKRCLVCGGNGFIGHHLANRLKKDGHFVRVVDIKPKEYPCNADEIYLIDLRSREGCRSSLIGGFDEVYQLAADMGGMGFISSHEIDCLTNNVQINTNMAQACIEAKVSKVFYSSSVCVYPDIEKGEEPFSEENAYPPAPDNEYGWEKLYSERVWQAIQRNTAIETRIARFQNCYGTEGTWYGGREKAPAALSRKIAMASKHGSIDVWGDGSAVRNYIYVDDLVDGIIKLMDSDIVYPTNIGTEEYVTVNQLIEIIESVARKKVKRNYVYGPVGVQNRNFSHKRLLSTGWKPHYSLKDGMNKTYKWIASELKKFPKEKWGQL